MKTLNTIILFLLIASTSFSQVLPKNTSGLDSVLISRKHFNAATNALFELKMYKKQEGTWQQRLHSKDVSIQYYERAYNKYLIKDSLNTILINNKTAQVDTARYMYRIEKEARKQQQRKTLGVGVGLAAVAVLSFFLGFYLHK